MSTFSNILMITGADPRTPRDFLDKIKLHASNGIKLIQFRAKGLEDKDYISLAKQAGEIGKEYGAKIILNTSFEIAQLLDADGIHLNSDRLLQTRKRPLPREKIVSAACHNLEQVQHAESIGVDLITLSPVLTTSSHPEAIPLGWQLFSELCKNTRLPVYALGGMREQDLNMVLSSGGYGIAAINSLWNKCYEQKF